MMTGGEDGCEAMLRGAARCAAVKRGEATRSFTHGRDARGRVQRLTISLDDDLAAALDELQDNATDSKANLIRRALRAYVKRQRTGERPTERDLHIWTELLANREHVILDVAHVRLLFQNLADAPAAFWDELRQIGVEHGIQYQDKGLTRVIDILQVMESANWFHVAPESEHSWALVFTEPSARPFVRAFLTGFFSQFPGGVEIVDERTKLRVRMGAARSTSTARASASRV